MKKILSLLSMLMITVTAFATSYTDQLSYKLTVFTALTKNLPAGELTVEPYGTSNYTVTAKGCDLSDFEAGNWDEIVCEDVAGTTDANGVTTITLDNPYAYRTSDNATFTATKLVVKFNGTKAYAHFEGKMPVMGVARAFEYTFGTDEGFESTGGGSTGGEDKPAIVTVKENFQSTEGSSWGENVTIDWNTQKLVASINLASTGSDKGFLGVTKKGQTAGWNNYGIIFYNTNGSTVQGYAPGQPNNANTDQVTKGEDPVRFEISKDGGVKCQGNVVISASNIAHLTNQSEIVVGAADKPAGALYNYIKVVSLDWTEPVTPPSVKEEKTFNEALYMVQGTTSTKVADAKVVVKEMSDETINMSLQFNGNEYTSTELTKGTDTKGRTTYTGKVSKDTQTFDVAGVVYEKDNAERLYMTMTATGVTFVVGENPDAVTPEAVVYTNNLTIVRGANHKVYENAEVTVLAKGEGKYEVTLPEFADMDLTNSGTVGKIVFTANGEEVDGVLQLTAENAAGVISTGEGWTNYAADVTMSGEVENNQLAAKFTVVLAGMSDYTYTLGYGKEIFIPTTSTVTDWANIKFGDSDPVNIENAKLDITMVSASTAMVTFKDVMINGNNIGDFAISDVKASLNPEDYTTILTTEATKGTWVRATENNALGVIVGAESDIRNFEGSQDEEAGKTIVKFGVFFGSAYGWADIVFGEKVETPDQPKGDYAINFDKDANSTHSSRVLNSFSLQQTGKDKQTKSVKTSKAAYEDHTADEPFTVEAGSELTASFDYTGEWMHSFVYIDFDNDGDFSYKEGQWDQTGTDLVAFSFYSLDSNPKNDASGYNSVGDELTGDARNTYAAPSFKAPAKAGEYRIRFKIDWNCILPGGSSSILSDGGGVWDATLKVVEPVVDGISTINAEVANGEAQLFTVDGVQIAKLQKGLNIVRTADGKVKKVLVK